MAERRMFAKTIVDSDAFLDMPLSTQALYFHLGMRADDEGFINNPRKIQRMIGASDSDLDILAENKFIIVFDTGIVVIKHWKINNYIRGDRMSGTKYEREKNLLITKENGAYSANINTGRKEAYANSSLPYSFTYKMRKAFEKKTCPVCGRTMTSAYNELKPTVQHNIPISKGGKHEIDNISIICLSCNTSIRDKETGALNNAEVVDTWARILLAEEQGLNWYLDRNILNSVKRPAYDGQVTDNCQTSDCIDKDSIGKDSIDIVDYLNLKSGKNFHATSKKTKELIHARLREGFTVDDFKTVIDKKVAEWKDDSRMNQYLRPETLFGTKFESYLNQQTVVSNKTKFTNFDQREQDWDRIEQLFNN